MRLPRLSWRSLGGAGGSLITVDAVIVVLVLVPCIWLVALAVTVMA